MSEIESIAGGGGKEFRSAWEAACGLVEGFLAGTERADFLLERAARSLPPGERGRVQRLFFGVVRHLGRLQADLDALLARPPRPRLRSLLLVAAFELLEGKARSPALVVDHAVRIARARVSAAEAGLVNAVLRRLAENLASAAQDPVSPAGDPARLAYCYSHPEWLVRRWIDQFGARVAEVFLQWNQETPPVYFRILHGASAGRPPGLPAVRATPWEGYWEVGSAAGTSGEEGRDWVKIQALLDQGEIYIQDPAARLAPELLGVRPGERVLDLCAAPGGKSLHLADRLFPDSGSRRGSAEGKLVCLERPGWRFERLKDNLMRYGWIGKGEGEGAVTPLALDLLALTPEILVQRRLPAQYQAVLLDAPCSNTGVLRHRVDAKWRLQPGDFARMAAIQGAMLDAAALRVAPGGRLVYSTCSVDPEENEQVVSAFLARSGGVFALVDQVISRPWETGHDGAGVFRLQRE